MRKKLTKIFWNIEVWAVQKHVNLVDLVKSFPTNIYLQNLASIQKRTSPVKFAHLAEKSGKGSISNLSTKVAPHREDLWAQLPRERRREGPEWLGSGVHRRGGEDQRSPGQLLLPLPRAQTQRESSVRTHVHELREPSHRPLGCKKEVRNFKV